MKIYTLYYIQKYKNNKIDKSLKYENNKIDKSLKHQNKQVFKFFLKCSNLVSCRNESGKLFHNLGPHIEKALSPYPLVRDGGTTNKFLELDLNALLGVYFTIRLLR